MIGQREIFPGIDYTIDVVKMFAHAKNSIYC